MENTHKEKRTSKSRLTITIRSLNIINKLSDGTAEIEVMRKDGTLVLFKIDVEDVPKIERQKWFYKMGYCCRCNDDGKEWYLTWDLLGKPSKGFVIHHIDGDKTNNRKSNLQLLTWSQHNFLKKVKANNSTHLRGISIYTRGAIVALLGPHKKTCITMEEAIEARRSYLKSLSHLNLEKINPDFGLNI